MPRYSSDKWEQIRAEREAGTPFSELAKRHSVSVGAIHKRAKAEGWGDGRDVAEIIRRKANEKVNGVVNAVSYKKRAEAIDAAAERSAEIIKRHQDEVNAVRERLYAGLQAHKAAVTKEEKALAFEDLKAAKIASETMLNIHRAERQAWGLETHTTSEIVIQNPRRY